MAERGPVSAGTGAGLEPRLGGLVGAGFASALLFGVGGFLPLLAPLALVSPVPLAVQRLQGGFASAVLAAALAASLVAATNVPAAAVVYLLFALPALLIAEAMARGRGLLRGCAWAFFALATFVVLCLVTAPQGIAESMLTAYDSGNAAFLEQLRQGAMPKDALAEWQDYVRQGREVLAVVYPAFLVISAAVLVVLNAAFLRLYLLRRDPGWLEDGEFERVRFPLPLVMAFVLAGAAVALPVMRPAAYNVLLVVGFFFLLQGLAVVGFYARRLAAPPLVRALALVLVLVNPWAPQMLALLGLFDNWFDFRHWAEPPKGPSPSGPVS
jgi:uncharacterized protein YybS (DUF2232 family)